MDNVTYSMLFFASGILLGLAQYAAAWYVFWKGCPHFFKSIYIVNRIALDVVLLMGAMLVSTAALLSAGAGIIVGSTALAVYRLIQENKGSGKGWN